MRYGILTGGGDVPGLNTAIKAVVRRVAEVGGEVVGFRRGWSGLLDYDLDRDAESAETHLLPLDTRTVRAIDRTGGTFLHTSRSHPAQVLPETLPRFLEKRSDLVERDGEIDCTPHILDVIDHLKLDALITIGGDGTLSYTARLFNENVPVMAIPKTMDNDVYGTDYCIGFSTAVTRSVEAITVLRTTTGSHERIAVIELFGRNSGETALLAGFLADADRVLIAEVAFDPEKLADLVIADRNANPSHYAMVVVSEGASMVGDSAEEEDPRDVTGQRITKEIGHRLGDALKQHTGIGIVGQTLRYLMRSGPPDALDQMVAKSYGMMAVQLLQDGEQGQMMALRDGNYTSVPADICTKGVKRVDVDALYDTEAYRPRIARVHGKPMFMY